MEVTWGVRFQTEASVLSFLDHLCRELQVRLHASTVTGVGKLILKVKRRHASIPQTNFPDSKGVVAPGAKGALGHGKCDDFSLGTTFRASVAPIASTLLPEVVKLYQAMKTKNSVEVVDLRGIGVQGTDLARSASIGSNGDAGMQSSCGIISYMDTLHSGGNSTAIISAVPEPKLSKGQSEQASVHFDATDLERKVVDVSAVQNYEELGLTESQKDMVGGLKEELVRQEVLIQIKRNNLISEAVTPVPNEALYAHAHMQKRTLGARRSTKPKTKLSRNDRTLTSMNLFDQDKTSIMYQHRIEQRVEIDLTVDEREEQVDGQIENDESLDSQSFFAEGHLQTDVSSNLSFPFDEKQSPPSSFSQWLEKKACEGAPGEEVTTLCRRYACLLVSQKEARRGALLRAGRG